MSRTTTSDTKVGFKMLQRVGTRLVSPIYPSPVFQKYRTTVPWPDWGPFTLFEREPARQVPPHLPNLGVPLAIEVWRVAYVEAGNGTTVWDPFGSTEVAGPLACPWHLFYRWEPPNAVRLARAVTLLERVR